jgi:predicted amidophosphoribosyltransferase
MENKKKCCMVCGKEMHETSSICPRCSETIKGEAVGRQKKLVKAAEKQIKQHGQKPDD